MRPISRKSYSNRAPTLRRKKPFCIAANNGGFCRPAPLYIYARQKPTSKPSMLAPKLAAAPSPHAAVTAPLYHNEMPERRADIAIVGAGIMGLAHAYAAAKRGKRVVVFERNARASGASIRNFGMIWPIGQPHGAMHRLALRSRAIWLEVLERSLLPHQVDGSLHLVYRDDETAVAREFAERAPALGYDCVWLHPAQVLEHSAAVNSAGLQGGLWSPLELTVDPPVTLGALPAFLREQYGVEFRFGCSVRSIRLPFIEAGAERWSVDRAVVCSGEDFETLYPELLKMSGLTRVKLQMLRTVTQPGGWRLGPALAAGLTLRFYPAFQVCNSLSALKERIAKETPEYDRWGIHGLVSQTAAGELTLGDSHEYGREVDIFNKEEVDCLILRYISSFLRAPDIAIAQRWHGVYAKHPQEPYLSLNPETGVHVVTSPGGSGMTLSFGIGEETLAGMEW
jgi:FAD dependent oxidoreductase TIGR03364